MLREHTRIRCGLTSTSRLTGRAARFALRIRDLQFLITGIDQSGCQIQDRVRVLVRIIKEVWCQQSLTQEAVADNKFFNLYGKRVRNIKTLQIFDRWGEMVYSGRTCWMATRLRALAGTENSGGDKALPGVYAFYAEVQYEGSPSSDKFKGEFTLVR
ncbi:MAG: hypothetical protein U0T81_01235 [Saprospiraceae bacterium]